MRKIQNGDVYFEQVARESEERKGQGVMLGCLIAWDKKNQKRKILYAVSGNGKILKSKENLANGGEFIFVDSIASAKKIENALSKNDFEIHKITKLIDSENSKNQNEKDVNLIENLKIQRTKLTDESLKKVFSLYDFTRFDGKKISLNEIIDLRDKKLPPAGTGDCCAAKLLSYAFKNELLPASMDEIYFGKNAKNKTNGISYPPCDERCGYILPEILGLEILYRDKDVVVVNKKAGMLSVRGKGSEKSDCVESRIKFLFPEFIFQSAAHRLDMETSGILILASNKNALKNLQKQFAQNLVKKKYVALLDGILRGKSSGRIELKFRLDAENRPRQIYDEINGKLAVTEWKKIGVEKFKNPKTGEEKKVTRIEFFPKTGRTHQLRLAASCEKGLNLPILGDVLYGNGDNAQRLMLHAAETTFFHPTSGKKIKISCKIPF